MVWKRDKVTAIFGQEPKEKRMWFKELKICFFSRLPIAFENKMG